MTSQQHSPSLSMLWWWMKWTVLYTQHKNSYHQPQHTSLRGCQPTYSTDTCTQYIIFIWARRMNTSIYGWCSHIFSTFHQKNSIIVYVWFVCPISDGAYVLTPGSCRAPYRPTIIALVSSFPRDTNEKYLPFRRNGIISLFGFYLQLYSFPLKLNQFSRDLSIVHWQMAFIIARNVSTRKQYTEFGILNNNKFMRFTPNKYKLVQMEDDCVRDERHDEMNGLECVPDECRSMWLWCCCCCHNLLNVNNTHGHWNNVWHGWYVG